MKFGLYGLHRGGCVDPAVLARRARQAEEIGIESLWVGDHLALPSQVGEPSAHARFEAVVALTHLAALTHRARLVAGVVVLPQRQPVLLAKQLSSLDVLSGGRLTVGIGVGYVEAELRALGVPPAERAARTDEYLAAIRLLWTGEPVSFEGRFVSFTDVVQWPPPVQRPHPPIVVGGHSPAAYRRAVRVGDGWFGWNLDLEQTAEALTGLRDAARRHGRPDGMGELEITVSPAAPVDLDSAARYAELGVHRLALRPHGDDDAAMDEVLGSAAGLVGRV